MFETVIKDLDTPPGTCEIDIDWSTYGVDDYARRKAVGREVRANPPGLVGTPGQVIGPLVAKDVLCDDAARKRLEADRIAAWQKAFHSLPAGAKPPPWPSVHSLRFSFPIFDRTYRRAILIRQGDLFCASFDEKGIQRKYCPPVGSGSLLVFRRDVQVGGRSTKSINIP